MQQVDRESLPSFLSDVNAEFCIRGYGEVYCPQFSLELWNYAQTIQTDLSEADKVIKYG